MSSDPDLIQDAKGFWRLIMFVGLSVTLPIWIIPYEIGKRLANREERPTGWPRDPSGSECRPG